MRPLSVTILAWVYIATGIVGFVYHFNEARTRGFQPEDVWIELVEVLVIVCGAYLLRGQNWARWLGLAWIASHVVLSAFHGFREFAIHCVFCAVIAWILFRPEAGRYFRGARRETT